MRCSLLTWVATKGLLRRRTMADRLMCTTSPPALNRTHTHLTPTHRMCVVLIFIIYLLCMRAPGQQRRVSPKTLLPVSSQNWHMSQQQELPGRGLNMHPHSTPFPPLPGSCVRWPTNLSQSQSFWRHISRALKMHRNQELECAHKSRRVGEQADTP